MNIFNKYKILYGVSRNIIIGFSSIIIVFVISVLFIYKVVIDSQYALTQLFDDHDKSVEQLYELREMVEKSRVNILDIIYQPKNVEASSELKEIHIRFKTLKLDLLKKSVLWDDNIEKKLLKIDLKMFDKNIGFQSQVLALLPSFESHNDVMKKFESEDILENAILPSLNKINYDVQLILDWKKNEKEASRKLLVESYFKMIKILLIVGLLMIILGYFASRFTIKTIVAPLSQMKDIIHQLSKGELIILSSKEPYNEIDEISNSVSLLISSMRYNAKYAESIGDGFFDLTYTPLSEKDELGYSLKQMNSQIKELIESLKQTQYEAIQARDKAESALAVRSQFLSVMSHEIRTPLNAIMGMSFLLNDASLSQDHKEWLSTIQFSSKNLLHLINEVLDLSKLEAGKVVISHNDLNVYANVNQIFKQFESFTIEKNIKFELSSNLNVNQYYSVDSYRLIQVLNNLLSNAIKFTQQGRIELSVNIVDSHVADDIIEFKVSDTGIGIDQQYLEVIFESFTQAEKNTTRLYGGTGLGLSICKKLVQLMGSEIKLKSTVGAGSEFSFRLQLSRIEKTTQINDTVISLNPVIVDGAKLLVVEDNSINAKVLGAFLKKWNVEYEIAENGKVAVDKIETQSYSLILMDLQMPILDGYEATKIIKRINPTIPIIALSAEMLSDIKTKIDECGFDDFVSKPFDPQLLINKIHFYLIKESTIQSKDVSLISFIKFDELAKHDLNFLKLVLNQVHEEFVAIYNFLRHGSLYIYNNKNELISMFVKLKPNLLILDLEELRTNLEEFINYETEEELQNSNLKLEMCTSIEQAIKEIQQHINNI